MIKKTKPEVFIIESLSIEDERDNLQEGKLISNMLEIAGKKGTQYFYIRTKLELENIIDIFDESDCRYLHISCHANSNSMATTFDDLSYSELGAMLKPCLDGRRVFVSGCKMANANLARELLPDSGCYSLIGPSRKINFDDSAAFWVSFYHLMFKDNHRSMKRDVLTKRVSQLSEIFEEPMNYFASSKSEPSGFKKLDFDFEE